MTPAAGSAAPGWMLTGFQVWREVRKAEMRAFEVYPHAAFQVLAAGQPLAKKRTPQGLHQRIELLKSAGMSVEGLGKASHDSIDAAVAALMARDARNGTAERVLCRHTDGTDPDGSSIWLPAPLAHGPPLSLPPIREHGQVVDLHAVMQALSSERPVFHSEADFQHALAWNPVPSLPPRDLDRRDRIDRGCR